MRLGSHLEALDRRIAAEAFDAAQDSRGCIGASCVAPLDLDPRDDLALCRYACTEMVMT